ncbi:transglutaminaseTgpA domain-containing protein [Cerasicoccus arenae]|uniref:Transglutaminase-like domain-containing protein n=1 Tax=Cerasicoccus arenae TaxID=424488 RepID=A0A8J3DDM4_9BACT|nr:DUF3488 and transglutaminase-like domain-containing protein [Cerasicoccus arenae]MBK1859086.1 DUF3488 domain-containing protein [Cerasicoccus arenae]GHC07628.1 hypothetical protein GCM10007047_25960 [Cerasicoccus arenae]
MPTSAAISRVRLSQDELQQLKWLLGQLLALIAMWSLWSLNSIPSGLILIFILGIGAVTLFPHLIGRIPDWVNKAATPALILIIAVDFILHGANFLDPMVRMVGFLTLYRSLQFRKRREDLQLLLLTLFTLIIVGVLLVSISFAVQMLIFTPIAMGQLFLVNLLEQANERILAADDWRAFSWRRFFIRLRVGLDFRLIAFAGVLFAIVVAISTVIFISLPRIKMDQAIPFLKMQANAGIGFSDTISYGTVNELLSGDDRVALQVVVSEPDKIPTRPYWRMVVLDLYEPASSTFRVSTAARQFANTRLQEGYRYVNQENPQRYLGGHTVDEMKFYLEGNVSGYLPLIGPFESISFPQRMKFFAGEEFNVFELDAPSATTLGYSLSNVALGESLQTSRREERALNAIFGAPILIEEYSASIRDLSYPETTLIVPVEGEDLEFLQAAVKEITNDQKLSAQEFSRRAFAWLSENYRYALSTGLPDSERSDHLIHWMRNANTGWCEHFSGAFIMLARTAGFPARAVAGFAGASWNDYEDFFVVRNRMAHAWVEIYDGNGRWLRADPTPSTSHLFGNMDSGLQGAMLTESGWGAWLDSVRMVWYRRVINFDQQDQEEIANNLRDISVSAFKEFRMQFTTKWKSFKSWLTEGWNVAKVRDVAVIVALVCFSILALRMFYQAFMTWRSARTHEGVRAVNDPIRRKAGRVLTRFRPAYVNAQQELRGEALKPWQSIYEDLLKLRFGDNPSTGSWKNTLKAARRLMRAGVKTVDRGEGALETAES